MDYMNSMRNHLDETCLRLLLHFNPALGTPMLPDLTIDTRNAGFAVSKLILAYTLPDSLHYQKPEVLDVIRNTLAYIKKTRRESGCFDLATCNFDTAPDTAFTLNQLMDVMDVTVNSTAPGIRDIRATLQELIEDAGDGIVSGGFHTPNHRWAIAAALKHADLICHRPDFSIAADRYLSEGLDVNEDGEFAERSAGIYNAVNDEQMIRLFIYTGDHQYLAAARANLTMMLHYFEPDGSVFTLNSTRQDFGHKVYPANYFILYLLTGYLDHDPKFAAWADIIWTYCDHKHCPEGLSWLLLYPDLSKYTELSSPGLNQLFHYSRFYPASGIARWRNGQMTCTVLRNRPDFLHIMNNDIALTLSVYSNVCEKRNFISDTLDITPAGCHLHEEMNSWYYLPFDGNGPDTSDWWAMDNPNSRQKQIRDCLTTDLDIEVLEDAIRLHFRWSGLSGVPIRLEFGFTPGTVRGEHFLLEGEAGKKITVTGGPVQVTDKNLFTLSLSDCFAEHNVESRMGGAYPLQPDRFTVILTTTSPADKTITISTKPVFRPALP